MSPAHDQLQKAALLVEPVRRALYEHVLRRAPAAVGRDEAAAAVGVSRKLAAFHLDRLAAAGIVEPVYRRLNGRSGPGAGRPSKLYRATATEVGVSVPARSYDVAARVFASALGLQRDSSSGDSVRKAARSEGLALGSRVRSRADSGSQGDVGTAELLSVLSETGFDPGWEAGRLRLRNCPFNALRGDFLRPVCEMSLALHEGTLEGAGARHLKAALMPEEGYCCVVFEAIAD